MRPAIAADLIAQAKTTPREEDDVTEAVTEHISPEVLTAVLSEMGGLPEVLEEIEIDTSDFP